MLIEVDDEVFLRSQPVAELGRMQLLHIALLASFNLRAFHSQCGYKIIIMSNRIAAFAMNDQAKKYEKPSRL